MVFYFTATGNSLYAARQFSEKAYMKGTKTLAGMLALLLAVSATACGRPASQETDASAPAGAAAEEAPAHVYLPYGYETEGDDTTADTAVDLSRLITAGTEEYRGFLMDNVLHSENDGDIHYHIYVPESYDGSEPYALFVTLPGYEGLYFQEMGVNLEAEEFAFEAQKYNENMIIAAPQLGDWGETSADQTIALTRYLLDAYNIDTDQVYANGYSGGGETMSLVLEKPLSCSLLICIAVPDGMGIMLR